MTRIMRCALAGTAILTVSAAASAQDPLPAEVVHWWTSGGESAAVQEFATAFEAAGGEWIDGAIAGGGTTARPIGINRILGGDPPTAMQLNTGTQLNELADAGLLRELDDIAAAQDWEEVLPAAFYEAVTRNGHVYAVPVNNHGQNWLWYSKAALEQAGVAEEPETWDEMFAALDALDEAGLVPLAVGGQPWQLNLMFNAILLGHGGRDLYFSVWRDLDTDAMRSEEFAEVVEVFGRLREYQDEGSPNRAWNLATAMLINGEAGFQFMGDWAQGEFVAAGQEAGADYGCMLGPGQSNFIMGGDVFIFPLVDDPAEQEAQELLATVMMSAEAQVAFNAKKGSVPVRLDVDHTTLDACSQIGVEVLSDPQSQIPAADVLAIQDIVQTIPDVVAEYWVTPSMTTEAFVENYVEVVEAAQYQ